jgi:transposase
MVERIRSGETAAAAVDADEDVVPASRVRELEKQVKELQRIIGKRAVTIEILEAAREVAKKSPHVFKGSKR